MKRQRVQGSPESAEDSFESARQDFSTRSSLSQAEEDEYPRDEDDEEYFDPEISARSFAPFKQALRCKRLDKDLYAFHQLPFIWSDTGLKKELFAALSSKVQRESGATTNWQRLLQIAFIQMRHSGTARGSAKHYSYVDAIPNFHQAFDWLDAALGDLNVSTHSYRHTRWKCNSRILIPRWKTTPTRDSRASRR